MKYSLIYKLADADSDSKWYNSASQYQAQNVADLIVQRSWSNDDAEYESLSDYIASKGYLDFGIRALTPTTGFWVNMPYAPVVP